MLGEADEESDHQMMAAQLSAFGPDRVCGENPSLPTNIFLD